MTKEKSLDDKIREMVKANCQHMCHETGLNEWDKSCPVCGCENPKYDPESVSDIEWPWPL